MIGDYQRRREAVLARRAIRREVREDKFIQRWIDMASQTLRELQQEDLNSPALNEEAERAGFRSARSWLDAVKDYHQAAYRFLHEPAFQALWALLRQYDKRSGDLSYAPTNGGVPTRLLDAVSRWHQAPKFTESERKRHDEAIAQTCQTLETLLLQVVPSHELDNQYSRLRFDNDDQARAIFKVMGAPPEFQEKMENATWPTLGWQISRRLEHCGVTPLWTVRNIWLLAKTAKARRVQVLPRKVRAKTAKRTYFIIACHASLTRSTFEPLDKLGVTNQHLAELAGLLSNMDCSSDDVRKALEAQERPPED